MKKTPVYLALLSFLLFGNCFLLAANDQETHNMWLEVSEILDQKGAEFTLRIEEGGLDGITEQSTGVVHGRWTEANPNRAVELGAAEVISLTDGYALISVHLSHPNDGSLVVQVGDMVELPVLLQKSESWGLIFEMVKVNVMFTDIYDDPLYYDDAILYEPYNGQEKEILKTMVDDIHFVSGEMRGEMDNPDITEGTYAGQTLFDMMDKAKKADVEAFMGYVKNRPAKYAGHEWRISEVFATWVHEGAPSGEELDLSWLEETLAKYTQDGSNDNQSSSGECGDLYFDLEKGTLNGMKPTKAMDDFRKAFPCYTGETEEGVDYNCGGGLFYLNHDFFLYSHRNYIEVRSNFKGKVSMELLGLSPREIKNKLGSPDLIPEYEAETEEGDDEFGDLFTVDPDLHYLYKRKYGTLRISFNPSETSVTEVAIHSEKPKKVIICW